MHISHDNYCGDTKMSALLEKAGAKMSLTQIYGLFYGCLSAPELVMPSVYHPYIFGEEGAEFESEEEAQKVLGRLMALWNALSGWEPGHDDFFLPNIKYENNCGGLIKRLLDTHSFAESFVLGLSLGKVSDSDLSSDARKAIEHLAKSSSYMINYVEVLEKEKTPEEPTDAEDRKAADGLENIVADCVARINIGLEAARKRHVETMRMMSDPHPQPAISTKISRNAPCPCGSGKKYKKCCGIVH